MGYSLQRPRTLYPFQRLECANLKCRFPSIVPFSLQNREAIRPHASPETAKLHAINPRALIVLAHSSLGAELPANAPVAAVMAETESFWNEMLDQCGHWETENH